MQALQHLRHILKTIAQDVEVLPAVGGAVELGAVMAADASTSLRPSACYRGLAPRCR